MSSSDYVPEPESPQHGNPTAAKGASAGIRPDGQVSMPERWQSHGCNIDPGQRAERAGGWRNTFADWLRGDEDNTFDGEKGDAREKQQVVQLDDGEGNAGRVSSSPQPFDNLSLSSPLPMSSPSLAHPESRADSTLALKSSMSVPTDEAPIKTEESMLAAMCEGPADEKTHHRTRTSSGASATSSDNNGSSQGQGSSIGRRTSALFRRNSKSSGRPRSSAGSSSVSNSPPISAVSSLPFAPSPASQSQGSSSSGPGSALKHIVTQGAASIRAHLDASHAYRAMREDSDERNQRRRSVEIALGGASPTVSAGEPTTPTTPTLATATQARGDAETVKRPPESCIDASSQEADGPEVTAAPSILDLPQKVPQELQKGEPMLKVTSKKVMQRVFRLDADRGQILWDSKKNNKVDLESICEVRWASAAAAYRTSLSISASHEPRWVSIIYQRAGEYKALHLIALSNESLARWKKGLETLQNARRALLGLDVMSAGSISQKENMWLRQQWKDADTNTQDEKLDLGEIIKLCKRLGIQSTAGDLAQKFAMADTQKRGYLDFAAFQQFVTQLKRRSDIEDVFRIWLQRSDPSALEPTGEQLMCLESFCAFLKKEQNSKLDDEAVYNLFEQYSGTTQRGLTVDSFASFLSSPDNAALFDHATPTLGDAVRPSPGKQRMAAETTDQLLEAASKEKEYSAAGPTSSRAAHHDMRRPLCEYYISSSHNTYLVGGQWKGDSTVEGYIRALQQGARSVELDCWDGSNNQPQITHGRTLTGKVAFVDVIRAIEKYAFVTSPYPLILSLEVHNDVTQQDVIARILRETLGDKLLTARLDGWSQVDRLPSPEALRGKILIKAKNLFIVEAEKRRAEHAGDGKAEAWSSLADVDYSASDETASDDGLSLRLKERSSLAKTLPANTTPPEERGAKKVLMSTALASLLVYTIGVKSRGINKKEVYAPEHMISLSEKAAFKYIRAVPDDLIKHNQSHLTRIYPSMSSIARLHTSANYLPHHLWGVGAQLVALNWQTSDLGMEINQAMFVRNGRSGYVLKPEGLRAKNLVKTAGQHIRLAADLEIISAQKLPRTQAAFRSSKEKEDDDDIISPSVSVTLLTPQSWGSQPQGRIISSEDSGDLANLHQGGNGGEPSPRSSGRGLSPSGSSASGDWSGVSSTGTRMSRSFSASSSISSVSSASSSGNAPGTSARLSTDVVLQNGFNPIWKTKFSIPVEVPAESHDKSALSNTKDVKSMTRGLLDLCFLRFQVNAHEVSSTSGGHPSNNNSSGVSSTTAGGGGGGGGGGAASGITANVSIGDSTPIASYTACLGSLQEGYRHLPLHDCYLTPHVFSTLFVHVRFRFLGLSGGVV